MIGARQPQTHVRGRLARLPPGLSRQLPGAGTGGLFLAASPGLRSRDSCSQAADGTNPGQDSVQEENGRREPPWPSRSLQELQEAFRRPAGEGSLLGPETRPAARF